MGRIILFLVAFVILDWFLLGRFVGIFGWKMALGITILTGLLGVWGGKLSLVHAMLRPPKLDQLKPQPRSHALLGIPLIILGAGLLLVPGFMTDVIGVSMLLPWTRKPYLSLLGKIPFFQALNQYHQQQAELDRTKSYDDEDTLNAQVVGRGAEPDPVTIEVPPRIEREPKQP